MKKKLPFKMLLVVAAINAALANHATANSTLLVNPANHHSYQRLDSVLNWSTAKTVCSNMGGHLATITSQAENDWIFNNVAGGNIVWLGGTDEGHEGTWTWITGETWNYANWLPNEPNNMNNGEHFLVMGQNGNSQWNDGGIWNFAYICEWETETGLPPNSITVYSNDFSTSAGTEWTDRTIASSNGEKFLGASADGFGPGSNTLTLNNLPAHNQITVNFDLYIIQTWDGNSGNQSPDKWQLTADGQNVLFSSFANCFPNHTQDYPNQISPYGLDGAYAPMTGAFEINHLGFGTGCLGDSTYRLSYTFAHTAASVALKFTGMQNELAVNEGWGLDNVRVSVAPPPDTTSGLVAYYPFNGNANDESGNGNNGALQGGVTLTVDRAGQPSSAYQFNGTDGYISVPSSVSLNPVNQWSMAFWMNVQDFTNTFSPLLHKGGLLNNSAFREYSVWLKNDRTIHTSSITNGVDLFVVSPSITTLTWVHYVGIIDRVNHLVQIYINGQKVKEIVDSNSIFSNNQNELRIGWTEELRSYHSPFKGVLDDIRIYNRALSAVDIQELYQKRTTAQQLSITKQGIGSGTITSNPTGINCGTTCAANFANDTSVTLTTTPNTGSVFSGWSWDSDPDCADNKVTLNVNKICTATFNIAATPPSVVTNAPSVITTNTARLQGTVNPNGAPTNVTFACNGLSAVSGNPSLIAADAGATEVSANLSGLTCNTQYTCRAVATNSAGTTNGNYQTFTTSGAICTPLAVTNQANAITPTSAVLNATVTPNGASTGVIFEFGPTTSYGTNVIASVTTINATSAAKAVRGNATLLTCNTTYNYRIKAVNSVGTTYGANASFKTLACPDLVVTKITPNPTAPTANGTFSATVTIKNQGGILTDGAFVDVWANKAAVQTCGAFGDDWAVIDTLAAGATTTVTVSNLPAGTPGMKLLLAFVDSDCSVVESNDANNQGTYVYPVNQPSSNVDFIVTSVTLNPVAPAVNGTFTATVTVKNLGAVAGDGKFLDIWSNQAANQLCGAVGNKRLAVGTVAAGATKTLSFTGIAAGNAGSKILRAFVDSGCSTGEKLESNNQFTKAYIMNAPSCMAIKTATPTAASGTYTIDPDGAAGAIAPFAVYCDMTTDGGGWTRIFLAPSNNLNDTSLDYTVTDTALRNAATTALIGYVDASGTALLANYARFAMPNEWKTQSPFKYAGTDVINTSVYVNGGVGVTQTLRFGNSNFSSQCGDSWYGPSRYGRMCITNTTAPFYSGFAIGLGNYCSASNQSYIATSCTSSLRFSIWVR